MFSGIHLRAILQEVLVNFFREIVLEITLSKLQPHIPGANEAISLGCISCRPRLLSNSITWDIRENPFLYIRCPYGLIFPKPITFSCTKHTTMIYHLLPPPWRRSYFHRCPLICLFICLSVSNITKKRLNGFSWNCPGRWDFIQGTFGNMGAQGVFVSNTTVKSMSGFSWHFQDMLAMTQGIIWNILGMIG